MATVQGVSNFEDTVEVVLTGNKTVFTVEKFQNVVGVYLLAGSTGDTVPFKVLGRVVGAPKNSTSEAWTAGQALYWDAGNNYFTTSSNGTPVVAVVAAAAGSSATVGDIILTNCPPSSNPDLISIPFAMSASSVDQDIWVADRACKVISIRECHSVLGGAGCVVRPRKITDTSAPGAAASGTVKELTTADIDMNAATINTVQSPALSATASDLVFAAGNRLALNFTGTMTGLVGIIIVNVQYT